MLQENGGDVKVCFIEAQDVTTGVVGMDPNGTVVIKGKLDAGGW